jgi:hypothetical protein
VLIDVVLIEQAEANLIDHGLVADLGAVSNDQINLVPFLNINLTEAEKQKRCLSVRRS